VCDWTDGGVIVTVPVGPIRPQPLRFAMPQLTCVENNEQVENFSTLSSNRQVHSKSIEHDEIDWETQSDASETY
jgi:hypothetical protein